MELSARPRRIKARKRPIRLVETSEPSRQGWGGRAGEAVRRGLDVLAAVVLLALTAPLLLAAAALVALSAGRPVFFGHRRVGRGGRVFHCWKLRTMSVDAEKQLDDHPELLRLHRAGGFKLPASRDPRIIRGGRWLRRTHLDELPQLFNVLVGEMSLVGPRPVVEEELRLFDDVDLLLSVRPGVFGEWTSRGRRRPPYPERARVELEWVRNRNPLRDLTILLRSARVVLRGQDDG